MAKLLRPAGPARHDRPVFHMTLLDLVRLLLDITSSEEETIRMAFELVVSGEVCLTGSFADEGPERWN